MAAHRQKFMAAARLDFYTKLFDKYNARNKRLH